MKGIIPQGRGMAIFQGMHSKVNNNFVPGTGCAGSYRQKKAHKAGLFSVFLLFQLLLFLLFWCFKRCFLYCFFGILCF